MRVTRHDFHGSKRQFIVLVSGPSTQDRPDLDMHPGKPEPGGHMYLEQPGWMQRQSEFCFSDKNQYKTRINAKIMFYCKIELVDNFASFFFFYQKHHVLQAAD